MTLGLQNATNARDLGGPLTRDGRRVRTGVLFRAGALDKLAEADIAVLAELKLACVVDFRDAHETAKAPDRLPAPAPTLVNLPVLGSDPSGRGPALDTFGLIGRVMRGTEDPSALEALREDAPGGGAAGMMADLYRGFVNSPGPRAAFAHTLRLIASAEELPLLFHCTAGKDRTGWLSAVLLTALGVDPDVILADYLRTNEAAIDLHEVVLTMLEGKVPDPTVILPMVQARPAYLEAGFAEAQRLYGDMAGYLRDGLDVDDARLAALRTNLLG
jgi:protein-tyrosine phosphatase